MRQAQTIEEINLGLIDVDGNPRGDPGDLDELAASIRERGVLEPIRVARAGARYRLIFGQRRLLACRIAGKATIPAIVVDGKPDGDRIDGLVDAIVENIQRSELNPIDEARAIEKLVRAGLSVDRVAAMLGRSKSHVENRQRLLRCDPYVVESIAAGTLPVFHGILLAALPHREQKALARRAITESWSQKRLEAAIRPQRAAAKAQRDPAAPAVAATRPSAAIHAGLAALTPKVPDALARPLLWALLEMDVFIQGRFESRHRLGLVGRDSTWRSVNAITNEQVAAELAQVLAEIVAEYGTDVVKGGMPRKSAAA